MASSHRLTKYIARSDGQLLVELLMAMALTAIMLPALLVGLVASRGGKAQMQQRLDATTLSKEAYDAFRIVREKGWNFVSNNGMYYPVLDGNTWELATGSATIGGFARYITISDVYRDAAGNIMSSGAVDPSTKKVTITVSWDTPQSSSVSATYYVVRTDNQVYTQGTYAEFNAGTKTNTQVTDPSDGRVKLSSNTKGQWCLPSFSGATISLPDGPPVSVASYADPNTISNPNRVFVATSPLATTSIKLAYVTVTANTDPPVPTLRGKFTMDASKYSNAGLVPTGTGLDNSFITNKVAYYKSSGGKTYALLATTKTDKEVIAILVDDGDPSNDNTNNGEFQDYVNQIYKYVTFFNTRIYQGTATQDQAPYGAGASSLAVYQDKGYVISGGYLYVFDLSNIDTKTTSSGLDMVGCRIELDGSDCNVSTSRVRKYNSGGTGTSFGSESSGLSGCNDGGMVEIFGDNDVYPISVGGSTYAYIAVGAGTDPEFNIVNVTNVPTSSTSPAISSNNCGRISNGAAGWKRISSLDFNSDSNTQETANSVFGKSDGTRAYISSNGTVDGDHSGTPDSDQFYVINTTNKSSPAFLSGTPSTGATSGYYLGSGANAQLYPRRSITVFGDSRALLAGIDGVSDGNNAMEYQVLNISNESSPSYCGGLQFSNGFNDMTTTVEADGDKYVYLIGSGAGNELKIIQGGPDGPYLEAGTFESSAIDIGSSATFNRFDVIENLPPQTSIQYQIALADQVAGSCSSANYVFVGSDGTVNTKFATGSAIPLNNDGTGFENPGRCLKYRAYLATTDYNVTPTLLDVHFNYSP
jgi:type II secretory pathway pseudopilin PulG